MTNRSYAHYINAPCPKNGTRGIEFISRLDELVSSEDGFTVHDPERVKLILGGCGHYLVTRSLNSKM